MPKKQLNDVERLAVAQAFYKVAGKLVSTKDANSLRSQIDREYKKLYDQTGSKSFDVRLFGKKVGVYSLKFSQPKPQEDKSVFVISDYEKLARWFETLQPEELIDYAAQTLSTFAEWVFRNTGEMPDGCELKESRIYGRAGECIGGTLKIDEHAVADALGDTLPSGFVAMLEGGEDENAIRD